MDDVWWTRDGQCTSEHPRSLMAESCTVHGQLMAPCCPEWIMAVCPVAVVLVLDSMCALNNLSCTYIHVLALMRCSILKHHIITQFVLC